MPVSSNASVREAGGDARVECLSLRLVSPRLGFTSLRLPGGVIIHSVAARHSLSDWIYLTPPSALDGEGRRRPLITLGRATTQAAVVAVRTAWPSVATKKKISSPDLSGLRRQQLLRGGAEHLHSLGPRALAEFMAEIADEFDLGTPLIAKLDAWRHTLSADRLDGVLSEFCGGRQFPPKLQRVPDSC